MRNVQCQGNKSIVTIPRLRYVKCLDCRPGRDRFRPMPAAITGTHHLQPTHHKAERIRYGGVSAAIVFGAISGGIVPRNVILLMAWGKGRARVKDSHTTIGSRMIMPKGRAKGKAMVQLPFRLW